MYGPYRCGCRTLPGLHLLLNHGIGRGYRVVSYQERITRRVGADVLLEPFTGPTVVVTHHAPRRGSLAQRYADDWASGAFVSELPDAFFDVPALDENLRTDIDNQAKGRKRELEESQVNERQHQGGPNGTPEARRRHDVRPDLDSHSLHRRSQSRDTAKCALALPHVLGEARDVVLDQVSRGRPETIGPAGFHSEASFSVPQIQLFPNFVLAAAAQLALASPDILSHFSVATL